MEDPAHAIPLERLVAHREWVRRVARALVRDEALAEDLEQEVWLEALKSPPASARSFGGWLAAAMRHNLFDFRRAEGRRRVREEAVARPEGEKSAADLVAEAEVLKRVVAAVLELDEPHRGALLLRYFEDLPAVEVARRQGVPLETARSRIKRAVSLLRERFDAESHGGRSAWALALGPLLGERAVASPAMAGSGGAVAALSGVALGGIVMTNKGLAAVAAVLVLAGAGWLALRPSSESAPASPPEVAGAAAQAQPPVSTTLPRSPPPAPPVVANGDDFPPPVDLTKCDRDLDLFGVVNDDDGAPVPGASVESVRSPWGRSGLAALGRQRETEAGPSTRSAVDGTFALRLRRGELVDLRGTAPGFGQGDLSHCQAGEQVRLVLRRRGGTLAVRAVDEEKRPVAGVRLRLWGHVGAYARLAFQREGVTGEDGRWAFAHLPAGKVTLSGHHDELGQPDWGNPILPAEGTLDWEVVLPRGRVVAGVVTDAATGKPIAGARLGSNWVMDRPVTTGVDGRYRFPGWTGRGTAVMTAAAEGYGSLMLKVPAEGDLDFALEAGFRAAGRVVDAEGSPVPGARVVAGSDWRDGERRGIDRASEVSDGDGRFSLGSLSRRARHDLIVEAPGHGRSHRTFDAPDSSLNDADLGDIELAGARAIEGRAVDPQGKALVAEAVILTMLRHPGDRAASSSDDEAVRGMGEFRRTDDLGRFRFPDLPPGRYELKLNVSDSPVVQADVDLPADRDVLDVVLRQKGRSVTLLVTDLAGIPLEGITVMAIATSPHPTGGVRGTTNLQGYTGTDGRVTFRNLPDELYAGMKGLRFSVQPLTGDKAPPFAWLTTDPIVPEGQEVRVALKPVAFVKGRVLGPEGEAIPGLFVNAFDATGKGVGVDGCQTDGSFSLRVPAGEPLTIRVPGHRTMTDPKDPTTGQSPFRGEIGGVTGPASDLVLRVRRLGSNGSIDVLVVDLEGKPVPAYEVGITRMNEPQRTAKTDSGGRLRFEGLLEETWYLAPRTRFPEGSEPDLVEPASVELVPSGQQVVLRYRRGVPLEGTVLHPDGRPAEGAAVWAQFHWGFPMKRTKTGTDGRFRLYLGEGDEAFLLTASWWNEEKQAFSVELRNVRAGAADLVLNLEPAKPR